MSKVNVRLQFSRYFFMLRKLFAIIECNGMASVLVGRQQVRNDRSYAISMLAAYMPRQHIARLTFSQRNDATLVILADHGISLPVSNA